MLIVLLLLPLFFATGCELFTEGEGEAPDPCGWGRPACQGRLAIGGGGLQLAFYRNYPLDVRNTYIRRLLVVVHGADRAWDHAFQVGMEAADELGEGRRTLVVAPFFQTADDGPATDEAYWTSSGWKRGHLSVQDEVRPWRVSSYAAMDVLLGEVAGGGRFPDLEEIVVAGHSAGGQYTHRYAAGGRAEYTLTVPVRYAVANPSTYLYLGPERAVPGYLDSFAVPEAAVCDDYQRWHYGLEGLNTYMSGLSLTGIRQNLTGRDVQIMVGDRDLQTAWLDMSCGAMLQGERRYHRGIILVNYMGRFWPGHGHVLTVVPGIGHSSRGMFTSEEGLGVLFPLPEAALSATALRAP
ncbi:MAG: hypothetical protein R6W82_02450 [bacterium]